MARTSNISTRPRTYSRCCRSGNFVVQETEAAACFGLYRSRISCLSPHAIYHVGGREGEYPDLGRDRCDFPPVLLRT